MTQPGFLPTFLFSVRREGDALLASGLVEGAVGGDGFHTAERHFGSEAEMRSALDAAGIAPTRYGDALAKVRAGGGGEFKIEQNEGQRLGVLHTDSPE